MFKVKGLAALKAFERLVAAVSRLHERSVIHRDIKPANVYIASDGRLVVGDFGIVFWSDDEQKRLTETYERVGSRDWMAPWANRGRRLSEINATFDMFPLGKLLWAMVSGKDELPYWYWQDDEHNLEKQFPDDPATHWINTMILAHTVVEREASCVKAASELLAECKVLSEY